MHAMARATASAAGLIIQALVMTESTREVRNGARSCFAAGPRPVGLNLTLAQVLAPWSSLDLRPRLPLHAYACTYIYAIYMHGAMHMASTSRQLRMRMQYS